MAPARSTGFTPFPSQRASLPARLEELCRECDELYAELHALRLRPDYAEAHNNLGKIQASEGHFEVAVAAFRRALEIDDELAEAHYNLGRALESMGNTVDAIHHFRRAAAL